MVLWDDLPYQFRMNTAKDVHVARSALVNMLCLTYLYGASVVEPVLVPSVNDYTWKSQYHIHVVIGNVQYANTTVECSAWTESADGSTYSSWVVGHHISPTVL